MCSPAAIPVVLSLVGTGAAIRSQQQNTAFEEGIADRNAQQAGAMAQDAVARGEIAVQNQRNRVSAIMGSQRAGIGASGIQNDTGTTGDVVTQTAALGELDAQTIRANALREAWGYKAQGTNFKLQSQLDQTEGQNAVTGSLITGAARAYGIYAQQNPPTFSGGGNPTTKAWLSQWGGYQ